MLSKLFKVPDPLDTLEVFRVPVFCGDRKWLNGSRLIRTGLMLPALLVLSITGLVIFGGFLGPRNFGYILDSILPLAFIVLGMTIIFGNGGFDFSVGSVMALSSVVFVLVVNTGSGLVPAVLLTILVALLVGLVNGVAAGVFKIPGMLITFITAFGVKMIQLTILNGSVLPFDESEISWVGLPLFFRISCWLMLILLTAVLVVWFYFPDLLKKKTKVDLKPGMRRALGIGIPYLVSGFLAGITGMFFAFRLMVAAPGTGTGLEFDVLIALVMGGAVFGSKDGNPAGVLLAALFLTMFRNLTLIANLGFGVTNLALFVLLILALFFSFIYNTVLSYLYNKKK